MELQERLTPDESTARVRHFATMIRALAQRDRIARPVAASLLSPYVR